MYTVLYAVACVCIANLAYKSLKNKARIAASAGYAVFVAFWMLLFSVLLFLPAWPFLLITYTLFPVFAAVTVFWFGSSWFVRRFGRMPKKYMEKEKTNFLITFKFHALLAKFSEILLQQALFAYILVVMLRGLPEISRLIWFLVMDIVLHLANILFMEKKETMFFFYWSLPMAILFGYLILHGYIMITASIHMIFYLLLYGQHWFKRGDAK